MTNNSAFAYTYELGEWTPFKSLPSNHDQKTHEEWLNECGFKSTPVIYGNPDGSSLLIYHGLTQEEVASFGSKIRYHDGSQGFLIEINLHGLPTHYVIIHDYPSLMHFLKEYSGVTLLKSIFERQDEMLHVLDEINHCVDKESTCGYAQEETHQPFLFDIIDEALNPKNAYQNILDLKEQLLHGDAILLSDQLSALVSLVEEGNNAITHRIKQLITYLMPALVELRDKGELQLSASVMHHYAHLANLMELAKRSDLSQAAKDGIQNAIDLLNLEEHEAAKKAKSFFSRLLDKATDVAEDIAEVLQQHIDKHK